MEIKDLKNYGKSLVEMMVTMPQEVVDEISKSGFEIVMKHLGSENLVRFPTLFTEEKERMSKADLSNIREKGLNDAKFINQQVDWASTFSALSKLMGKAKTIEILDQVAEAAGPRIYSAIFPAVEEARTFEDPFSAFKEWFLAMAQADEKAGAHTFEHVEDSDDAIQLNAVYCAWYEIPKKLGVPEACLPNCHTDDVFLPGYCQKAGMSFKRTAVLAKGGEYCDFRFERQKTSSS